MEQKIYWICQDTKTGQEWHLDTKEIEQGYQQYLLEKQKQKQKQKTWSPLYSIPGEHNVSVFAIDFETGKTACLSAGCDTCHGGRSNCMGNRLQVRRLQK